MCQEVAPLCQSLQSAASEVALFGTAAAAGGGGLQARDAN